ncbi:hypothetical protein HY491_00585 [Candidatus Woesearchaeota archaeon]|nr:hypothetical protein [Candidatus Woesearchaeota archaeon]
MKPKQKEYLVGLLIAIIIIAVAIIAARNAVNHCGGIEVENINYYCGAADSVCPADFGADCSGCMDRDCG